VRIDVFTEPEWTLSVGGSSGGRGVTLQYHQGGSRPMTLAMTPDGARKLATTLTMIADEADTELDEPPRPDVG
jgi:hypothetical protein